MGPWKMHLATQDAYGPKANKAVEHDPPVLYNLDIDPSERQDVATDNPKVIEQIRAVIKEHQATLKPAVSQLENANVK